MLDLAQFSGIATSVFSRHPWVVFYESICTFNTFFERKSSASFYAEHS